MIEENLEIERINNDKKKIDEEINDYKNQCINSLKNKDKKYFETLNKTNIIPFKKPLKVKIKEYLNKISIVLGI